jgi:very-short-patch-repair endonuclease
MKRPNIDLARNLRRQQTDAERLLWSKLSGKQFAGIKFRRQHTLGDYIVDFISIEKNLIIEIDGSQHGEALVEENDKERTAQLENMGYSVIRFWNNDVSQNIEGVAFRIGEAMGLPLT